MARIELFSSLKFNMDTNTARLQPITKARGRISGDVAIYNKETGATTFLAKSLETKLTPKGEWLYSFSATKDGDPPTLYNQVRDIDTNDFYDIVNVQEHAKTVEYTIRLRTIDYCYEKYLSGNTFNIIRHGDTSAIQRSLPAVELDATKPNISLKVATRVPLIQYQVWAQDNQYSDANGDQPHYMHNSMPQENKYLGVGEGGLNSLQRVVAFTTFNLTGSWISLNGAPERPLYDLFNDIQRATIGAGTTPRYTILGVTANPYFSWEIGDDATLKLPTFGYSNINNLLARWNGTEIVNPGSVLIMRQNAITYKAPLYSSAANSGLIVGSTKPKDGDTISIDFLGQQANIPYIERYNQQVAITQTFTPTGGQFDVYLEETEDTNNSTTSQVILSVSMTGAPNYNVDNIKDYLAQNPAAYSQSVKLPNSNIDYATTTAVFDATANGLVSQGATVPSSVWALAKQIGTADYQKSQNEQKWRMQMANLNAKKINISSTTNMFTRVANPKYNCINVTLNTVTKATQTILDEFYKRYGYGCYTRQQLNINKDSCYVQLQTPQFDMNLGDKRVMDIAKQLEQGVLFLYDN